MPRALLLLLALLLTACGGGADLDTEAEDRRVTVVPVCMPDRTPACV